MKDESGIGRLGIVLVHDSTDAPGQGNGRGRRILVDQAVTVFVRPIGGIFVEQPVVVYDIDWIFIYGIVAFVIDGNLNRMGATPVVVGAKGPARIAQLADGVQALRVFVVPEAPGSCLLRSSLNLEQTQQRKKTVTRG